MQPQQRMWSACNDLLDHLVGAGEQRCQSLKRPSVLAVLTLIVQLVLGWFPGRKIARLLTLEDAVDVAPGRVPVLVERYQVRRRSDRLRRRSSSAK